MDRTTCCEAFDRPAAFGQKSHGVCERTRITRTKKKQKKICHDYHKPHLLKAAVTNVQGRKTIRHTFAAAHVRSLFVDIMRQRSMHVLMVARNMTTLTLSIYNFGRLLHDNVLLMNFPSHFCRLLSFIGYE